MAPTRPSSDTVSLLESLRHDRGLGLRDIAKLTGITHKTILKWEREGILNPHAAKLRALARLYNVPAAKLLLDVRQTYARRQAENELVDAA